MTPERRTMQSTVLYEPCGNCPFRNDKPGFLAKGRAREIIRAMERGEDFPCHKTLDYEATGDDLDAEPVRTQRTATCAGYAILCELQNRPTQMMCIAERIGLYDREKLNMKAPVHRSTAAFVKAQEP